MTMCLCIYILPTHYSLRIIIMYIYIIYITYNVWRIQQSAVFSAVYLSTRINKWCDCVNEQVRPRELASTYLIGWASSARIPPKSVQSRDSVADRQTRDVIDTALPPPPNRFQCRRNLWVGKRTPPVEHLQPASVTQPLQLQRPPSASKNRCTVNNTW